VPVTEPIGDISKAEQDKAILGTWVNPEKNNEVVLKIDAPEVKGNPKGLMRMFMLNGMKDANDPDPLWFFVATVGKEKFGNACLERDVENNATLDLGKEGGYEKWTKQPVRVYFVFRYTSGKDELTINFGDADAFKRIADDAGLKKVKDTAYQTSVGWFEKYLDKNGSDKIFPQKFETPKLKRK
jgi:hypothetical protein